jgi:hypothetical protein
MVAPFLRHLSTDIGFVYCDQIAFPGVCYRQEIMTKLGSEIDRITALESEVQPN